MTTHNVQSKGLNADFGLASIPGMPPARVTPEVRAMAMAQPGVMDAMNAVGIPVASEGGDSQPNPYMELLKHRIVVIQDQVDPRMQGSVTVQLLYLDTLPYKEPNLDPEARKAEAENGGDMHKPITLYINTPGGSVIHGQAIVDTFQNITSPIRAVGIGIQASMGSIILAATNTRPGGSAALMRHATVMIHQPLQMSRGESMTQYTDIRLNEQHFKRLNESLKEIYVEHTGLNHKFWDTAMERDTYFTAEQGVKLGFGSHVIMPRQGNRGPYAADAKRPITPAEQKILDDISKMTATEVMQTINTGNAGEYAPYRAEMVVRMAELPEFWTPTKKLEMEAKAQAKGNVVSLKPGK